MLSFENVCVGRTGMIVAPLVCGLVFITFVTLIIVCCCCIPRWRMREAMRKGRERQQGD